MTSTGWAVTIVAILIIAGGGWWYIASTNTAPATIPTTNEPIATTTETGSNVPAGAGAGVDVQVTTPVVVTYTANGFSPATVTVPVGATVTFVNESGRNMWVGADEHPTHTEYDGTGRTTHCAASYTGEKPFDQCANTNSYSFTFTKAGTFDYHNHSNAQSTGRIVVQ
jgi:plastocyanin